MSAFFQSKDIVRWYRALLIWGVVLAGGKPRAGLAEEIPPAPAAIQALIDAGQVQIDFYNPQTNPRRFLGETDYDYHFRHTFQADYEPVRVAGRMTGVKVRLKNIKVSSTHTHKMHLPEKLRGPNLWNNTLTRHEFDHVSMSTDPRLVELLQGVFQSVDQVRFSLPKGQEFTTDWLNKEIDTLLNARGNAVYAIVTYNNKILDQITAHGTKPIPERESYFQRLYTKPNLDDAGFTLTGEVLDLLKSEAYQKLAPHYLP